MEYYKKCLKIATKAHEGQKRWNNGEPYINHPLRVASQFTDDIEKSIAILHDVLEDTDTSRIDLLEAGVCMLIIEKVTLLSRAKHTENYFNFIRKICLPTSGTIVREIKIADIEDNLRDLKEGSLKDKYRFARQLLRMGDIWT